MDGHTNRGVVMGIAFLYVTHNCCDEPPACRDWVRVGEVGWGGGQRVWVINVPAAMILVSCVLNKSLACQCAFILTELQGPRLCPCVTFRSPMTSDDSMMITVASWKFIARLHGVTSRNAIITIRLRLRISPACVVGWLADVLRLVS